MGISIHTPLAGSDLAGLRQWTVSEISIHTPLAGSDKIPGHSGRAQSEFQSTLPLRGATNTPSGLYYCVCISIHTPLAGSDVGPEGMNSVARYFNPHSPCGERLSISADVIIPSNFNPHSPCGERLMFPAINQPTSPFQSTLPLRGATVSPIFLLRPPVISIHTPLAGSDRRQPGRRSQRSNFNPHSPCGERLCDTRDCRCPILISIHTPLAGSD